LKTLSSNSFKHLSLKDTEKRVRILSAIQALEDAATDSLWLVSADEILEMVKSVVLLAQNWFSQGGSAMPYRNPDIIVGETNVSNDRTVAGTVESREKRFPKGIILPNSEGKIFFENLFGLLKQLQSELKNKDSSSFELVSNVFSSILEALRLDRNPDHISNFSNMIRKEGFKVFDPTRVATRADRSRVAIATQIRVNRNLGYLLRKAKKASKSKAKRTRTRS
jgi:hypothetical protein